MGNVCGTRKLSSSMILLCACVLGLGLGLFVINSWHATKCANDGSTDETESLVEALRFRLVESEGKIRQNELMMNKLVRAMQSDLFKLSPAEYRELTAEADREAVDIALVLAAQPALPMPYFAEEEIGSPEGGNSNIFDDIFQAADDRYKKNGGGGFYSGEAEAAKEVSAITDAEAIETCTGWKAQYHVIVGVSWGELPFDLQQKWIVYSCDYHSEPNPES